jgi:hypothetical protein
MTALAVPGATDASAVNVTCCVAPASNWNGAAGDVLTPAGSPATFTVTFPVKEFKAVIWMEAGVLVDPCVTDTCRGETPRAKSWKGLTDIVAPAE